MTTPVSITPRILGQALDVVDATQNEKLGVTVDIERDGVNGKMVYGRALSIISSNNWVAIDENGKISNLTIANMTDGSGIGRKVGICEQSVPVSSHAWVYTKGKAAGKVAQACADRVPLFPTTTPGVVDDATSSAGGLLLGAYTVTTTSTASAITTMLAAEGVSFNWSNPA